MSEGALLGELDGYISELKKYADEANFETIIKNLWVMAVREIEKITKETKVVSIRFIIPKKCIRNRYNNFFIVSFLSRTEVFSISRELQMFWMRYFPSSSAHLTTHSASR